MQASTITAVLGPTNSGKTHRAIERMLEHETGVMGLPLRLLAREVYDRVTSRVGREAVALVTGEEKRVPRRPRFWICTVEAMPSEKEVDFVAIDEVQLAVHPQRGHVFTDRMLHARGRLETLLLGSEAMRPMIEQLVPTARFELAVRMSTLRAVDPRSIGGLPPRSAVVAFSAAEVYDLAERLKRRRGGAAVVLGALSPRTRNAQVAMYQAGEVDHLVATDAIGMGLNLDLDHVAFAGLSKYDGREARPLEPAEVAQIAGRAGRHVRDGTFGGLTPVQVAPGLARAVECHRFPSVRQVLWREHDLDWSSLDTLLASLGRAPTRRVFRRVEGADDSEALARLATNPAVRSRVRAEEQLRLLWEVCQIPDYKKLLFEVHVAFLGEVFEQLSQRGGAVDVDWFSERVRALTDATGDMDEILARIASIRALAYIANHGTWVPDGEAWREETRTIEDRLSDALHERLVQRFVEKRGRGAGVRKGARRGAKEAGMSALALGLAARLGPPEPEVDESARWVEDVVEGPHERFRVDAAGKILDEDGRVLARMVRGVDLLHPEVKLALDPDPGAGARLRIQRRLVAWTRDLVARLLEPLRRLAHEGSAPVRGLVYQLERGLGTARADTVADVLASMSADERDRLAAGGLVIGFRVVFLPELARPEALAARNALVAAQLGTDAPAPAKPGVASLAIARDADVEAYLRVGYPVFGPRAIRADLVERVIATLARDGDEAKPQRLASVLGCPVRQLPPVVDALAADMMGST